LVSSLNNEAGDPENENQVVISSPPKPKSWAGLFHTNPSGTPNTSNGLTSTSNTDSSGSMKSGSLVEALRAFSVNSALRISFLEPRGLVNTGNMCYMNSVSRLHRSAKYYAC
jgi:ubiquitin carboxyl-terminal hydrolase 10